MPVSIKSDLKPLSQLEFAELTYEIMAVVFSIHNKLGGMFDEEVYKALLTKKLNSSKSEVGIDVSFLDFNKIYLMDLVIENSAIFELKSVTGLNPYHRSQLLNYLLLTEQNHGKLVNFGAEAVEHEFVNTTLTHKDRTSFFIQDDAWQATSGFDESSKELITHMLLDWGTGLDIHLYQEAIRYFLCPPELNGQDVTVLLDGVPSSRQRVDLCAPHTAIKVTTFNTAPPLFIKNLKHFVENTELTSVQWINISNNSLSFLTVTP